VELAMQYSVDSKEFQILANANRELRERFAHDELKGFGVSLEEYHAAGGIALMQKLYHENLRALAHISTYILENEDWRKNKYETKDIGRDLGYITMFRFVDSMMKLNRDAGPEVQHYLYAGMLNSHPDSFPDWFAEIEPCRKMLEKGPEQMLKLLNNPDLMQKFTVDAMHKLNEHSECRNIVYKMNMMEFTGPLPVNPDGTVSELAAPAVTVKMMG
jgi:hypothetical protein